GSLFGVWVIGGVLPSLQPFLGVARWVHVPVILGLGVLIGATFTADIFIHIQRWSVTVFTMIFVTVIVTFIGYMFLTRLRGYDSRLAFLCSVPGGQAEATVMARELVDKDYVVALFHLIRVTFVFLTTPLLLALLEGQVAVSQSNIVLQSMPSLTDLGLLQIVKFLGIAVGGYFAAHFMRIPMPHLTGPIFLSAGLHIFGIVAIPRINEFVIIAQLVIGGAVGARLAQVSFSEVLQYLSDGLVNTVLILAFYLTATFLMSSIMDVSFLEMWLAFVPGGLYEVTLLALIFGFDIAFVAFHHTVRIMMVFLTMPFIITRMKK
ncbi:MAG: AbrB family transcriptional regulator, partial [Alphaproteobacteria bacterium]|nr:AbrB family transcriptional regulator [Alphaproteobacteria bacterium]